MSATAVVEKEKKKRDPSKKSSKKKSSKSSSSSSSTSAAVASTATPPRKTRHKHKIGAHKSTGAAASEPPQRPTDGFSGPPKIGENEIVLIEKQGEGCFGTVW